MSPGVAAISYYDTSALLKRYDPNETGSAAVLARFASPAAPMGRLTRVEVLSGLRIKERTGALTGAAVAAARTLFDAHSASEYAFLEPTPAVVATAERLVLAHKLRAYDAVHVPTALALTLAAVGTGAVVEFVTADADQGRAAAAEGLTVVSV